MFWKDSVDLDNVPEPYGLVEHEVGNFAVKARVADKEALRDGDDEAFWDDFDNFLLSHDWYQAALKKDFRDQRQKAKQRVEDFITSEDTPARSRDWMALIYDSYEVVEGVEEAMENDCLDDCVTMGEVLFGVEEQVRLREGLDNVHISDYDSDLEVYGNEALWLPPHTGFLNWDQNVNTPEAEDPFLEIDVEKEDNAVYLELKDNGPGIDKKKDELLETDRKGFRSIHFITNRFYGDWDVHSNKYGGTTLELEMRRYQNSTSEPSYNGNSSSISETFSEVL